VVKAETASKARYAAFKAWREAGYGQRGYPDYGTVPFADFLKRVRTLHCGEPSP
jgi:hypothetical protein